MQGEEIEMADRGLAFVGRCARRLAAGASLAALLAGTAAAEAQQPANAPKAAGTRSQARDISPPGVGSPPAGSGSSATAATGNGVPEDAATKDGAGVAEIVVTAQFRETNLQNTPISITAVNADQLRQRSITNVLDVAQAAPNITMTEASNGGGRSNQAFIRGIGQSDFSFAFEPKVGFYIDDVYFATIFGAVFDLLDIERVEIERGPQGTLNGRNSVGGAVRIFNKKPLGDGSGYIEGTYGSFDRKSLRAAMDVALVPNTLALRIAAGKQSQDGWVKRLNFACANPSVAGTLPGSVGTGRSSSGCKVGTLGGTDFWNARAQLRYTGATVEDNISFDYTDDTSEAPPVTLLTGPNGVSFTDATLGPDGVTPARPPNTPNGLALLVSSIAARYGLANPVIPNSFPATLQNTPAVQALLAALNPQDPYVSYASYGNPGVPNASNAFINPPINTVKSWGVSNVLDVNLADKLKLTSITAYRRYTGHFGSSDFGLPTREALNGVLHHQFTQEVRLAGSAFDDRLQYAVGGFYLKSFNENDARAQTSGFAIYTGPVAGSVPFILDMFVDDKSTVENISGFAHANFQFNTIFSLEGGLRYTHEKKGYSYFRQNIGQAPNLTTTSPDFTIERWNPRVSVNAQLARDLLLYGSYSTGFTAGGNNPRPFFPGDVNLSFGPEKATAYELGYKSLLFGRRVRFNGDVYYTDYKDIQVTLLGNTNGCVPGTQPAGRVPCTIFYYGNGGNAHIKGFEAELETHLIRDWLLTGSVGYTKFKYTKLAPGVNPTNDLNGTSLDSPQLQVPKWKFSVGTQYDVDLGDFGVLTPHIDMVYQSTVHYSPSLIDDLPTQRGYALANARITWRDKKRQWSLAGYVTNLTNKLYYTNIFSSLNGFGAAEGQVGAPRQFGLTLRRNF